MYVFIQVKKIRKPPAVRILDPPVLYASETLEAPLADVVSTPEEPAASRPECSRAIGVDHSYVTMESPR